MNSSKHPRVLLVSGYDFHNGNDATSITLRSIFSEWDKDSICNIYCGLYDNDFIPVSNCLNLNIKDLKLGKLVLWFKRKKDAQITNSLQSNTKIVSRSNGGILKQKVRILFSAVTSLLEYKKSDKLNQFIEQQNPTVIYFLPSSRRDIKLVIDLHRRYHLPVILHFMDDWPTTLYKDSMLYCFVRQLTLISLRKIIDISTTSFVISEAMAKEYYSRYKKHFHPLMHNLPAYIGYQNKPQLEHTIDFCYAGGMHLNRWCSLLELCSILKNIDQVKFSIFTKSLDWENVSEKFLEHKFIHYAGFLKNDEMLDAIKNFDFLVFIESFDEEIKEYTRFSLSTKIPEYLSLGKPIIAIGPSDIASIQYLKENDVALVLDEKNKAEWSALLKRSIDEKDFFSDKIEKAKNLFCKNHLREKQHNLLLKIITDAVSK